MNACWLAKKPNRNIAGQYLNSIHLDDLLLPDPNRAPFGFDEHLLKALGHSSPRASSGHSGDSVPFFSAPGKQKGQESLFGQEPVFGLVQHVVGNPADMDSRRAWHANQHTASLHKCNEERFLPRMALPSVALLCVVVYVMQAPFGVDFGDGSSGGSDVGGV